MGYNSNYRVYVGNKCLGQFSGWTSNDAIKMAQKAHPNVVITKVICLGENNLNNR